MNRIGRVALLSLLVAASGCGGSSEDDVERAVHAQLQRAIDDDDASGREVLRVSCREKSLCMARVRTRAGDRFTGVKIARSGDDVSVLARVDQGEVRPGPVEEGLERDLPKMLGGEVVDVTCDRDRSQCSARVREGGQERVVGVLVGLDDSDDFSIVTTFEQG